VIDGSSALEDGAPALNEGASALKDGAPALKDGAPALFLCFDVLLILSRVSFARSLVRFVACDI